MVTVKCKWKQKYLCKIENITVYKFILTKIIHCDWRAKVGKIVMCYKTN